MPLTEIKLKSLKPRDKIYRVADAKGLCIEVQTNGARYWRYRYRHAGKPKMVSLGVYPEVSLADARAELDKHRGALRSGEDPSAKRQRARLIARNAAAESFEAVSREWLAKQQSRFSEATYTKAQALLETWLFPWLGGLPVGAIEPAELLAVLRRIEKTGRLETALRARQRCGQIFRYAIATQRAKRDPAADLRGALEPPTVKHRAAIIDPRQIGALLRAIDGYSGFQPTRAALQLAPLVFLRPSELRKAEWTEIYLDDAEWRIPAARMKMKLPHIVPLPRQAIALLKDLRTLTGAGRHVFPSARGDERPLSENTLNYALQGLGYSSDTMTPHGFRTIASTHLHEMGWPTDAIERQLAHAERNRVKGAYNRAEHLPLRREMMQAWADHLDQLRTGGL